MSLRLTEAEYLELQKSRTSRIIRPSEVQEWIPIVRDEKELLEDAIQAYLIEWADNPDNQYLYPGLDMVYAIPNGSNRGKVEAWKHKLCGLRSGIPDLHLPVSRKPFFSLYIELKNYKAFQRKGHSLSDEQNKWIEKLRKQGHRVEVLWSLSEAMQMVREYLGKRKEI